MHGAPTRRQARRAAAKQQHAGARVAVPQPPADAPRQRLKGGLPDQALAGGAAPVGPPTLLQHASAELGSSW
jgi:hypothetical protein